MMQPLRIPALLAVMGLALPAISFGQVHFIPLPDGFEAQTMNADGTTIYGLHWQDATRYTLAEWTLDGGMQILSPTMTWLSFVWPSRFLQCSDDGNIAILKLGDMNGALDRGGHFFERGSGLTRMAGLVHSDGGVTPIQRPGSLSGDGAWAYGTALRPVWPTFLSWAGRWSLPGISDPFCGESPNDCGIGAIGVNFDGSALVGYSPNSGLVFMTVGGPITPIAMFSSSYAVSGDAERAFGFASNGQAEMWSLGSGVTSIGMPPQASALTPLAANFDGTVSFWTEGNDTYRWDQVGGWQSLESYLVNLGADGLAGQAYTLGEFRLLGRSGHAGVVAICTSNHSECRDHVVYMEAPIPGSVGANYCGPMTPNSSGVPSSLRATGSRSLLSNDLVLEASDLPPNQFGVLLSSQGRDYQPILAHSPGTLCLGGTHAIGIHHRPQDIRHSGSMGTFAIPVDASALPLNGSTYAVQPGDTLYFQVWHRETSASGPTTQFTNGVQVEFY